MALFNAGRAQHTVQTERTGDVVHGRRDRPSTTRFWAWSSPCPASDATRTRSDYAGTVVVDDKSHPTHGGEFAELRGLRGHIGHSRPNTS